MALRHPGPLGARVWGGWPSPASVGSQDELINTPGRIRVTREVLFEGMRSWSQVFQRRWGAESYFALRSSHGAYRRG